MNLSMGNGGLWQKRVAVVIRNDADEAVAGQAVGVVVGKKAGQADLVGVEASGVRVCAEDGAELLFALVGPAGQALRKGPVPEGATLMIPAECAAKASTTVWVYAGNPDAWGVTDFLPARMGVINGGMEEGAGDAPAGWAHDVNDAGHVTSWASEGAHGGRRCLKTVVAESAEPTWISTRQIQIGITGGARYVLKAWVKGKDVKGSAGWYIHVGNEKNSQMLGHITPPIQAPGGTFDWREISFTFTAPMEATKADIGTVLRGTGTAWFDDVTLECLDPARLTATAGPAETIAAVVDGTALGTSAAAEAEWGESNRECRARMVLRIVNLEAQPARRLVSADVSRLVRRSAAGGAAAVRVTDGSKVVPSAMVQGVVVFEAEMPAHSVKQFYAYAGAAGESADAAATIRQYAEMIGRPVNRVKNGRFELMQEGQPADWSGGLEGTKAPGSYVGVEKGAGIFGGPCAIVRVAADAAQGWRGLRQKVPVQPGRTYLFSTWVKGRDVNGRVLLNAHYLTAKGAPCAVTKYASAGTPISGTSDWRLMSGTFTMPADAGFFELHLTTNASGTVWFDGVFLAEVNAALVGKTEGRPENWATGASGGSAAGGAGRGSGTGAGAAAGALSVWQVNAIEKVFEEDVRPDKPSPWRITAARNEREPLQLAIRSDTEMKGVRIAVEAPPANSGATLANVTVNVVGYVPVDHPSGYFESRGPAWRRRIPAGGAQCDGWAGWWPDPLLPADTLDLPAGQTRSVWVTVAVPKDAPAGDYTGQVALMSLAGVRLVQAPFTVHVWDFALPDQGHCKAVYDLRTSSHWKQAGKSNQQVWDQLSAFMAEHRVSPDRIAPEPVLKFENGKVTSDFTDFDKSAEVYFNRDHHLHTYAPQAFYAFGWGHPPATRFGQKPYEGAYPFESADRGKLRAEFKQAYQACLKVYWEHMKQKGWADRVLLYMSDEPMYEERGKPNQPIIDQMKALCAMVREVDPNIPIYSSTWGHVPQWDGAISAWGIGAYGIVPVAKIGEILKGGAKVLYTVDGHMCLDTPYCAIERLLPHYCFEYGVEGYEFWGATWLTQDPYQYGWHCYITQGMRPGDSYSIRYPNGDGYLIYPGAPIGHAGPVSSIRLEQAREGVEDYEYLWILRDRIARAKSAGKNTGAAEAALAKAAELVTIPNAGGRYSTKILPRPEKVMEAKEAVGAAIEGLR